MHADHEREVEVIARQIIKHLKDHPRAADSAPGIARWWLAPPHDRAPMEQVEDALERLVARGVLRRLILANGGVLYSTPVPTSQ